MVDHERLMQALVEFARTLVTTYEVGDVLEQLCVDVTEVLDVTGSGVMLADQDGTLRYAAGSNELVGKVEQLQVEVDEGPCRRAYETGQQVLVPDLEEADWLPKFAPRAVGIGLRAMHSFPMLVDHQRVGTLDLFCNQPTVFGDDTRHAAALLADMATTYLLSAQAVQRTNRLVSQLQTALETRIVIEQAKGKLAAQHGCGPDEAFRLLRTHARSQRQRIHAVARAVMEGQLHLRR